MNNRTAAMYLKNNKCMQPTHWLECEWQYFQVKSSTIPWQAFPAWQLVMWFSTFFMVRQWGRAHCRISPLAWFSRLWHLCAWSSSTSCCWISLRLPRSAAEAGCCWVALPVVPWPATGAAPGWWGWFAWGCCCWPPCWIGYEKKKTQWSHHIRQYSFAVGCFTLSPYYKSWLTMTSCLFKLK